MWHVSAFKSIFSQINPRPKLVIRPSVRFIDTCSVHGSAPPQIRVRPTSRVRESQNVRDVLDRHELMCMWYCSVVRLWLSSAHVSLAFVIALHSDVPAEL